MYDVSRTALWVSCLFFIRASHALSTLPFEQQLAAERDAFRSKTVKQRSIASNYSSIDCSRRNEFRMTPFVLVRFLTRFVCLIGCVVIRADRKIHFVFTK